MEFTEDEVLDVPSPYCYHLVLVPEDQREAIRQKFIHDCNLKRFQHIIRAEPPKRIAHVPKPADNKRQGVAGKTP